MDTHFTPMWIAAIMWDNLHVKPDETVLDPACGTGNLLVGAMHKVDKYSKNGLQFDITLPHDKLYGYEIQKELYEIAKKRVPNAHIKHTSAFKENEVYDKIITNPPWGKDVDDMWMEWILHHFKKRACILFDYGILIRKSPLIKIWKKYLTKIIIFPQYSFEQTKSQPVLLVLDKTKEEIKKVDYFIFNVNYKSVPTPPSNQLSHIYYFLEDVPDWFCDLKFKRGKDVDLKYYSDKGKNYIRPINYIKKDEPIVKLRGGWANCPYVNKCDLVFCNRTSNPIKIMSGLEGYFSSDLVKIDLNFPHKIRMDIFIKEVERILNSLKKGTTLQGVGLEDIKLIQNRSRKKNGGSLAKWLKR